MPIVSAAYDAASDRWRLMKEDGVTPYTDAQVAVIERELQEALGARALLDRIKAMPEPSLAGLVVTMADPVGRPLRFEAGTDRRITNAEWQVLTDRVTALRQAKGLPV